VYHWGGEVPFASMEPVDVLPFGAFESGAGVEVLEVEAPLTPFVIVIPVSGKPRLSTELPALALATAIVAGAVGGENTFPPFILAIPEFGIPLMLPHAPGTGGPFVLPHPHAAEERDWAPRGKCCGYGSGLKALLDGPAD